MAGSNYRLRSSCRSSQPNLSCSEQSIENSVAGTDRVGTRDPDYGISSQLTALPPVLEQPATLHQEYPLQEDAPSNVDHGQCSESIAPAERPSDTAITVPSLFGKEIQTDILQV